MYSKSGKKSSDRRQKRRIFNVSGSLSLPLHKHSGASFRRQMKSCGPTLLLRVHSEFWLNGSTVFAGKISRRVKIFIVRRRSGLDFNTIKTKYTYHFDVWTGNKRVCAHYRECELMDSELVAARYLLFCVKEILRWMEKMRKLIFFVMFEWSVV